MAGRLVENWEKKLTYKYILRTNVHVHIYVYMKNVRKRERKCLDEFHIGIHLKVLFGGIISINLK